MLLRLVNLALLLATLVGAVLSVRAGLKYQRLRQEHRQLMNEVGLLRITDPQKVHLVALKTDDPLNFAWQMYVPKGYTEHWHLKAGGSSSRSSGGANSEAYTHLLRLRLRPGQNRYWEIWCQHHNGSSLSSFGPLDAPVDGSPPLVIEQFAKDATMVLEPDQAISLLRASKPGDAAKKPLVELRFGPTHALVTDEP